MSSICYTAVRGSDPDAGILEKVQAGDAEAFGELVARHRRRVYRTLFAIIGNVDEAQDALQETFLKAFQHIGHFQGRSKFSSWLTTIASNTALQKLRDDKHWEPFEDETGKIATCHVRRMRTWESSPEELYVQFERSTLVKKGLMKVPSKYRAVLLLRDIEQLSTEEAALALGLGVSALKARLYRARMMLRDVLSSHFESGA